jgi:hypothetical protein
MDRSHKLGRVISSHRQGSVPLTLSAHPQASGRRKSSGPYFPSLPRSRPRLFRSVLWMTCGADAVVSYTGLLRNLKMETLWLVVADPQSKRTAPVMRLAGQLLRPALRSPSIQVVKADRPSIVWRLGKIEWTELVSSAWYKFRIGRDYRPM